MSIFPAELLACLFLGHTIRWFYKSICCQKLQRFRKKIWACFILEMNWSLELLHQCVAIYCWSVRGGFLLKRTIPLAFITIIIVNNKVLEMICLLPLTTAINPHTRTSRSLTLILKPRKTGLFRLWAPDWLAFEIDDRRFLFHFSCLVNMFLEIKAQECLVWHLLLLFPSQQMSQRWYAIDAGFSTI